MEKGDSIVNIRTPSQVGFHEMNRANLPATTTSLKLPLLIVACALILTLVLGLSIGLSNRNKNKRTNRVIIVKNNSTNTTNPTNATNSTSLDSWSESYKKADEFISKLNSTERVNLLFGTENMIMEK